MNAITENKNRTIRKYHPADLLHFQEFWKEQGSGRSAHEKWINFQWLVGHNPFSSTRDDYLVLEEGGSIVAYEGMMPFMFSISGQTVQGCIYHDTMVSPERRGRGLGTEFVGSIMEQHPGFSIAVWMNEPNSKVFGKCGWKAVEGLYTYAKIFTANNLIQTRYTWLNTIAVKGCNLLLSIAHSVGKKLRNRGDQGAFERLGARSRKQIVRPVEYFDERVDALFDSVRSRFPFIAFRTQKALNWKYSRGSFPEYRKLISVQGEDLTGYMVFKTRKAENGRKIATIFDFLCSPENPDPFDSLLENALEEIERSRPDTVEILCSSPAFIGALKRRGFLRIRENPHALKYFHPQAGNESTGMGRGENWFFTFGDGDKVFWDF